MTYLLLVAPGNTLQVINVAYLLIEWLWKYDYYVNLRNMQCTGGTEDLGVKEIWNPLMEVGVRNQATSDGGDDKMNLSGDGKTTLWCYKCDNIC